MGNLPVATRGMKGGTGEGGENANTLRSIKDIRSFDGRESHIVHVTAHLGSAPQSIYEYITKRL